jgi:hypothetical protein
MEGRLPNLLIIGAMKAGTTSLHDYLNLHPDIFMSTPKEIHFFEEAKFGKFDLDWYRNFFRSDRKIVGTSPQNYTKCHNKYYQGIPKRLKKHLPKDLKMIYILRDPIERYRSHILENYYGEPRHDVQYNVQTGHYLKTSMYFFQLQEYLKYFELDQIHITTLEALKKDRLGTLNKIFTFLGVPEMKEAEKFNFVSNAHHQKVLPYYFKTSLLYKSINKLNPELADWMARSKSLKRYIFWRGQKKYLSPRQIQELQKTFRPDVDQLRALTGQAFEQWSI